MIAALSLIGLVPVLVITAALFVVCLALIFFREDRS